MRTITLLTISFFFISCVNSTSENTNSQTETAMHDEHEHDDENAEAIGLNYGAKWKVDKNMMAHIQNIEKDVASFVENNQTDYPTLAKKIATNLDLLTSNCTMEGKAHDELHKWLLPFLELSEDFFKGESEQGGAANLKKIETSLVIFNTYFE